MLDETLRLLAQRRSAAVPLLSEPGPNQDQIDTLITLASRVPDHGKLAPWRFILFRGADRAKAAELIFETFAATHPEADEARLDVERRRFSAPVIVGVVSRPIAGVKIPEWEQILSAGAVCMNLTIAANAMGFATSWLTEWYAYDRSVLARFGLTPQERMAGFIHIGTAPGPREDRIRPALSDILSTYQADK